MATFPSDSVRTKNWSTEILTDSDLESQLDLIHDYIKAELNSSTGHSHDGTSNQGPKLTSGAIGSTFVSGLTTVTGASGDYLMLADVSDSNNPKKALASDFIFVPSATNALSGSVIQSLTDQETGVLTGTALIPQDDTIPQQSGPEGFEVCSQAITPSNASNIIEISGVVMVSPSGSSKVTAVIYQDSTAGALKAIGGTNIVAGEIGVISIYHKMTAGTTSSTTFKLWVGQADAGTLTVNGIGGARYFGGVAGSYLNVKEIKA